MRYLPNMPCVLCTHPSTYHLTVHKNLRVGGSPEPHLQKWRPKLQRKEGGYKLDIKCPLKDSRFEGLVHS